MILVDIVNDYFGKDNLTCKERRRQEQFLRHFMGALKDELGKTGRCIVPGLGTIHVRYTPPRPVKNPRTGRMIERCKARFAAHMRLSVSANTELLKFREKELENAFDIDYSHERED